jgi:hypothetical protein
MKLEFSTPALLFPAITLLMLAYTNRFLALASLIRKLHGEYTKDAENKLIINQIKSLRRRIHMIRYMQSFGILSFFLCVLCMYCVYLEATQLSHVLFATSLICLMISLFISLVEIQVSTKALDFELSDMEGKIDTGFIDYIKKKFDD